MASHCRNPRSQNPRVKIPESKSPSQNPRSQNPRVKIPDFGCVNFPSNVCLPFLVASVTTFASGGMECNCSLVILCTTCTFCIDTRAVAGLSSMRNSICRMRGGRCAWRSLRTRRRQLRASQCAQCQCCARRRRRAGGGGGVEFQAPRRRRRRRRHIFGDPGVGGGVEISSGTALLSAHQVVGNEA